MSKVSLVNLVNLVDQIAAHYRNIEDAFFCLSTVSGYRNLHDAPQAVQDAESDITYLDTTIKIFENLFKATDHSFDLSNPEQ